MSLKLVLPEADPRYPEEFAGACVEKHLELLATQIVWDCLTGVTYKLVVR